MSFHTSFNLLTSNQILPLLWHKNELSSTDPPAIYRFHNATALERRRKQQIRKELFARG